MDINLVRSLITAALLVLFVLLCLWAYSKNRVADFDEAARLPLGEDDSDDETAQRGNS